MPCSSGHGYSWKFSHTGATGATSGGPKMRCDQVKGAIEELPFLIPCFPHRSVSEYAIVHPWSCCLYSVCFGLHVRVAAGLCFQFKVVHRLVMWTLVWRSYTTSLTLMPYIPFQLFSDGTIEGNMCGGCSLGPWGSGPCLNAELQQSCMQCKTHRCNWVRPARQSCACLRCRGCSLGPGDQ